MARHAAGTASLGGKALLFADGHVAEAVSRKGRHRHSFGGPLRYRGSSREDWGGRLLHKLFELDLTDPVVPLRLQLPGLTRLPLLYCFDFRVNRFGYQCVDDETVHVLFWKKEANVSRREEFPEPEFPEEFPERPISLRRIPFDPSSPGDAFELAGAFGLDGLSPVDRTRLLKEQRTWFENVHGEPPETDAELREWMCRPFLQGRPNSRCPNADCRWNRRAGGLVPFAVVPSEPVPGVRIFGESGQAQVVFEICGDCRTIAPSNQSG